MSACLTSLPFFPLLHYIFRSLADYFVFFISGHRFPTHTYTTLPPHTPTQAMVAQLLAKSPSSYVAVHTTAAAMKKLMGERHPWLLQHPPSPTRNARI